MTIEIEYKKGWKQAVKRAWLRKKIANMDVKGIGLSNAISLAEELGMNGTVLIFRKISSDIKPLRTCGEFCVINKKGLKELEKPEYKRVEPMGYLDDSEHYDDEGGLETSVTEFIKSIEELIIKYPKVHFRIGGEDPIDCTNDGNWDSYVLARSNAEDVKLTCQKCKKIFHVPWKRFSIQRKKEWFDGEQSKSPIKCPHCGSNRYLFEGKGCGANWLTEGAGHGCNRVKGHLPPHICECGTYKFD